MPAPKRPNTAEATRIAAAKARRRGQETMAAKLREAGWLVFPPEQAAEIEAILHDAMDDMALRGHLVDDHAQDIQRVSDARFDDLRSVHRRMHRSGNDHEF